MNGIVKNEADAEATVYMSPRLWRPAKDVFGQTYYLLRWSIPMLLLWLTFAIAYAWRDSGVDLPMTSISAYYYTHVQTVFVGVLMSLGALLIVIQGRTPWEDALMNTAGALAPFVALLPTPVKKSDTCIAPYCTSNVLKDVIPNNHEIIAFNVKTVIPIWMILCVYLAIRAWTMRKKDKNERRSSSFGAAATFAFGAVGLALWFSETERQVFYDWAHLTSAGAMLVLLIVSIVPFATWMGPSPRPVFSKLPHVFSNVFWLTLWLILIGLAVCVVIELSKERWDHTVLVVEIVAIIPFFFYWVMQGIALGERDRNAPPSRS